MPAARRRNGFTLIELMVTIAIAAVAMMVAAPSFMEYRRNSELSDAVGNMILAAGSAKSAALKTGRNVYVRPNDATIGWRSGWFVYIDSNWNGTYQEGTDELVIRQDAIGTVVTATPASGTTFADNYLMFNGQGFPRTSAGASASGALTFATANRSTNVIIDSTGRARSCKVGTTGCSAT